MEKFKLNKNFIISFNALDETADGCEPTVDTVYRFEGMAFHIVNYICQDIPRSDFPELLSAIYDASLDEILKELELIEKRLIKIKLVL